jgi:hypothetical protein
MSFASLLSRATAFREHFFAFGKAILASLPARATAFHEHFFASGKTVLAPVPALSAKNGCAQLRLLTRCAGWDEFRFPTPVPGVRKNTIAAMGRSYGQSRDHRWRGRTKAAGGRGRDCRAVGNSRQAPRDGWSVSRDRLPGAVWHGASG